MTLTREDVLIRRTAPERSISKRWSLELLAAWVVLFPLALALEPAAAAATPAAWEYVASYVLLGGIAATTIGLARRSPWALSVSVLTAALFGAGVIACPTTGHHAFGLWWIGELACALALVGISAAAILRQRSTS